jgi:hypothetical protein
MIQKQIKGIKQDALAESSKYAVLILGDKWTDVFKAT